MRRILNGATALALLLATTAAHAESKHKLQLGAGISLSEGTGLELRYPVTENISLRSAWYGFNHSNVERIGSIDFDLDLSFSAAGGFIDIHPDWSFLPGLRFTAGVLLNNDDLRGTALPRSGYYRIGRYRVPTSQIDQLNARARYNRTQPYLGIGYAQPLSKQLTLSTDLGILFQGPPAVDYDVTGSITQQQDFASVLAVEERKAEDDLKDYSHRPVARLVLMYQF